QDLNSTDQSECGSEKSLAYIEISKKLVSDVIENFPKCSKPIVLDENLRDCSEVLASGRNKSGVYTIWPKEHSTTGKPLKIYCDMETDGGGWTEITLPYDSRKWADPTDKDTWTPYRASHRTSSPSKEANRLRPVFVDVKVKSQDRLARSERVEGFRSDIHF
ncbi:hypothetical protein AVEN_97038-1, partial [Araneus ventricosus]